MRVVSPDVVWYQTPLLEDHKFEGQVIVVALIRIRDNEAFEQAFRRFKKSCEKAGILSEVKKREHFEKPSVRKKKKSIAARKRALKKGRTRF